MLSTPVNSIRIESNPMKAELENIIVDINKSLNLLSKRVGWETAESRLEELNVRCEDTNLWSDVEKAKK